MFEDINLKRDVFHHLDEICDRDTLLISGTSTLNLREIASNTQNPERVLLANYSNPPLLVPLVEITRDEMTSEEAVSRLCDLLRGIGKKPVVIQRDLPGFVANRLQMALLREAISLVEKGIVSAQDIDEIVKSSIGRR